MSAPFQYKALYVRLRAGCGFVKPLFIKPHTAAPEDEAAAAFDGRSIFVAGVPKRMDKAQLEEVFALFGPLTTVRPYTPGAHHCSYVAGKRARLSSPPADDLEVDFTRVSDHCSPASDSYLPVPCRQLVPFPLACPALRAWASQRSRG